MKPMRDQAESYRPRAIEAEREARKAHHAETRQLLLGAAKRWRELAREAEGGSADHSAATSSR